METFTQSLDKLNTVSKPLDYNIDNDIEKTYQGNTDTITITTNFRYKTLKVKYYNKTITLKCISKVNSNGDEKISILSPGFLPLSDNGTTGYSLNDIEFCDENGIKINNCVAIGLIFSVISNYVPSSSYRFSWDTSDQCTTYNMIYDNSVSYNYTYVCDNNGTTNKYLCTHTTSINSKSGYEDLHRTLDSSSQKFYNGVLIIKNITIGSNILPPTNS